MTNNNSYDGRDKRKYYRLHYVERALMPKAKILGSELLISEVSERGIRLIVNNVEGYYVGRKITANLKLYTSNITVDGEIIRLVNNEVILKLNDGVSFKQMLEEQRHLRNEHPTIFRINV